jgi:hypothetical protein
MFSLCSGLNSKNNDFMRLLVWATLAFVGVAVVSGGLILFSGGDVLCAFVCLVASGAGLIFMARSVDAIRATFIDCLTPNRLPLTVLPDSHLLEAAEVTRRNLLTKVFHELNEPAAGICGLAKRDVPPPLRSV